MLIHAFIIRTDLSFYMYAISQWKSRCALSILSTTFRNLIFRLSSIHEKRFTHMLKLFKNLKRGLHFSQKSSFSAITNRMYMYVDRLTAGFCYMGIFAFLHNCAVILRIHFTNTSNDDLTILLCIFNAC